MREYKFDIERIKHMGKKMMILVDTREKQNTHILNYFQKHHIAYRMEKLDFGDYSFLLPNEVTGAADLYFHREIVIERKASLEELSGNLTRERDRFEKELLTAKSKGCTIHFMIEDPRGYQAILEGNYRTEMKPAAYMASLATFQERYGVHISFLDPQYSGYMIYQTFYYHMREALK